VSARWRRHGIRHAPRLDRLRRRPGERRRPGKHFVQHATKAEEIAATVEGEFPALLGLMYAGVPTAMPVEVNCYRRPP
jgi:hypothetical protein